MESFDFGSLIPYLNGIKFTCDCSLAISSVRSSCFLLRALYERKTKYKEYVKMQEIRPDIHLH